MNMNPAGGANKGGADKDGEKKRGRPLKVFDPNEDPKKKANREAQNKYKQKVGNQVNKVVDDLDDCEEERALLKDKVKSLNKLLKTCDDQVADIMKAVNAMPKSKAKPSK